MPSSRPSDLRRIPAIVVHQWLTEWNRVIFDDTALRRRPEPHFYLFALPAPELKSLCGIYRRSTEGGVARTLDLGIERRHDPDRSQAIGQYVHHGYPWSELSPTKKKSAEFDDLRKPGWLPTAIVVNILKAGDRRRGLAVSESDLLTVGDADGQTATIVLPRSFTGSGWTPSQAHPIEVIDGQHRLWAFEDDPAAESFELPVVAFHGLDVSWQAYLFWTINIKPKRINASLAFDLYPLLRTEDWLEKFEGHSTYREARAGADGNPVEPSPKSLAPTHQHAWGTRTEGGFSGSLDSISHGHIREAIRGHRRIDRWHIWRASRRAQAGSALESPSTGCVLDLRLEERSRRTQGIQATALDSGTGGEKPGRRRWSKRSGIRRTAHTTEQRSRC